LVTRSGGSNIPFGTGERQSKEEYGSFAPFAFHPDLAAMSFNDALRDGQPQSSALMSRPLCLPIPIEYMRDIVLPDAWASVAYGKTDFIGSGFLN
jgi:hypothetical protein